MLRDDEYAPLIHRFLALLEEGDSTSQAARKINRSRMWVWRIIAKSKSGQALAWIAEEFERIRCKNARCDICSTPLKGEWIKLKEDDLITLDFCGELCRSAWVDVEEN
jgi:hypothetical protein